MNIKALRTELDKLLKVAKDLVIDHQKIADKLQYSYVYIAKVRAGERCNNDTKDNRDLIQSIIYAYRKEIEVKLRKLDVTFKELK